ncbi:MAG TPA: helix-turn-helix transcriptional regulator [Bryobacteraceae bacterium]|nr:helix-turn-helix transcriptional regulator [Bryobacteraceae bacterium]
MSDAAPHELIRLIYEAAGDPSQWVAFLEKWNIAIRSSYTAIAVHDLGTGKATVAENFGLDPAYERPYVEYYSTISPWASALARIGTPGRVIESSEVMSDHEMMSTEFYNDWLRPQPILHSCGSVLTREGSVTSYLSALRSPSVGPYDQCEVELLEILIPHLQCAVRLHQRIAGLEIGLRLVTDTLDRLPGGVIIASPQGRALVMNRAAESILARKNGLHNGPSGLYAWKSSESNALLGAILTASRARDGAAQGPVPILISRDGAVPLRILAAPLPPQSAGTGQQPAVVLFITDPEDSVEPDTMLLRRAFGLTLAESRIAAGLMQGKSVEDLAAESGLSLNTVRAHLKKVFAKTNTRRQGQLVRVLLSAWPAVNA